MLKFLLSLDRFPEYNFISDNNISKSAGLSSRYSEASLHGIILDIHFLANSDFLVCTFSSQVSFGVTTYSGVLPSALLSASVNQAVGAWIEFLQFYHFHVYQAVGAWIKLLTFSYFLVYRCVASPTR